MFKVWPCVANDRESLAQMIEHHLNESAEEVISVSYAVTDVHQALVVYREISSNLEESAVAAVDIAEQIVEEAQTDGDGTVFAVGAIVSAEGTLSGRQQ